MADQLMSDAQLRRRRKAQGKIGRTTSTLGLTGVGLAGTGALLAHKPGALKAIPKLRNANPEKLKSAAFHTGIVSGGIGGIGGFNQAAIYSDEARRKKQTQVSVKKELGMEMGYYGEEGRPVKLPGIKVPIEKAWSPVATNYDPEAKRHKRAKTYQTGLTAAAGGTGATAAVLGAKAGRLGLKNRKISPAARNLPRVNAAVAARKAAAVGHGKAAGLLGAGSAAAAGGAALVHRGRKNSWQSYGKRDSTSAFGVDHADEEVTKAINIKPENKGKFTALAHKRGQGVQEAAHKIAGSDKATELQRKRAQFAINAKKWKH